MPIFICMQVNIRVQLVCGKGCGGWLGLIIKMINDFFFFFFLSTCEGPVGASRTVQVNFFSERG